MQDVATGCSVTAKMGYKTFCRVLLLKIAMHRVEKKQRGWVRPVGTTLPGSYNGENTSAISPCYLGDSVLLSTG